MSSEAGRAESGLGGGLSGPHTGSGSYMSEAAI